MRQQGYRKAFSKFKLGSDRNSLLQTEQMVQSRKSQTLNFVQDVGIETIEEQPHNHPAWTGNGYPTTIRGPRGGYDDFFRRFFHPVFLPLSICRMRHQCFSGTYVMCGGGVQKIEIKNIPPSPQYYILYQLLLASLGGGGGGGECWSLFEAVNCFFNFKAIITRKKYF